MQQHEGGQKSPPQFGCPLPTKLSYLQQACHRSVFTCISLKMTPRSLSISLWPRVDFKIISDKISTANRRNHILT